MPMPLEGLTVVDLTQVLSGPYCTMLLADMGADVVKVEPLTGDSTRQWGPFLPEDAERSYGGYFQSVNRNKRGIAVDLKSAAGKQVLLDLLAGADVLVENYRVGVMDRLGLSWESLHERFRRLVYAAIRGFGDPSHGREPLRLLAGVRHRGAGHGRPRRDDGQRSAASGEGGSGVGRRLACGPAHRRAARRRAQGRAHRRGRLRRRRHV